MHRCVKLFRLGPQLADITLTAPSNASLDLEVAMEQVLVTPQLQRPTPSQATHLIDARHSRKIIL